jgi:hypothetical protein
MPSGAPLDTKTRIDNGNIVNMRHGGFGSLSIYRMTSSFSRRINRFKE